MRFLISIFLFLGCTQAKEKTLEQSNPSQDVLYAQTAERTLDYLDKGFVISHGSNQNKGDSLFFTSLAMYALDCTHGKIFSDTLQAMMKDENGGLSRHPDLIGQLSLDGLLAFYRGVTHRIIDCGEKIAWASLLGEHKHWTDAHTDYLPAGFTFVRDRVLYIAGIGGEPAAARQAELEIVVGGWAETTLKEKAACYRVNLGLISLQTIEASGRSISKIGRDNFCFVTKDANIPTVDKFCGRTGMDAFLTDFKYNVWQYRHQRCPGWENPDGVDEPGIDYLVAYADAFHGI